MNIKINGENTEVKQDILLGELFESLKIKSKIMAIAVNMAVIKKDNQNSYILKQDDEVEFLDFVGGG